jgi:hypothetical protein
MTCHILGLAAGWYLGDRCFFNNPVCLALVDLLGMIAAVLLYPVISAGGGARVNAAGPAAIGYSLYIADSIVSGTAARDIGGAKSIAPAAGIINAIGSTAKLFAGKWAVPDVSIGVALGWLTVEEAGCRDSARPPWPWRHSRGPSHHLMPKKRG